MKRNSLRARIIELFGTQADFASFIKADETLVSRIVNGRREIPESQRAAWAKALQTKDEELKRIC